MADEVPPIPSLASPEIQPIARPASVVTVYADTDNPGDGHKQTAEEKRVHAARRRAEKAAMREQRHATGLGGVD